ncbi:MAG TPA: ATP-binding protein [Ktedonobacterales bacterium]
MSADPAEANGATTGPAGVAATADADQEQHTRQVRESLERLEMIGRATGQIFWTMPPSGAESDRPFWREFTGQSGEQSREWGWLDVVHPDDQSRAEAAWRQAIAAQATYEMEFRVRRGDGAYRDVLVRVVPVLDEQGRMREWVGALTDVTERKELERRLRATARESDVRARQLEATFAAITDGVVIYAADGAIAEMNAAARRIFRLVTDEGFEELAIGERTHLFEVHDGEGASLAPERWPGRRLLAGEVLTGSGTQDVVFRGRTGAEVWLNVSGAPMRDESGAIIGAVAIYHDVTDRRQLERRTHDALAALLEMAEALVRLPDEETPVGERSEGATAVAQRMTDLTRRVLGCSRVGITALDLATGRQHPVAVAGLPDDQIPGWQAEVEAGPPLDESPLPELTARMLAGETFALDLTAPPFDEPPLSELPNPYGITTMVVAPLRVRDQTIGLLSLDHSGEPHHYTDEELGLAEAVAKLAALVIERERLLRERAAAEGKVEALAETNRRMDDFLSMASHELRTPLTTLKANVQLAQRQLKATGEGRTAQRLRPALEMLARGDRQVDLLNRLVGDLLDMSRIQSQRLELRIEQADLAAIVRQTTQEQRLAWPERTIALEAPDEPVPVEADADRIGQVLGNYLTNALKYSEGDRSVSVVLTLDENEARVSVTDHGPGLPPDELERIWERFHRAEGIEVLSGSGVGLGLGLHIGKTLIERHEGTVGVTSVVGDGSTFWFALPLARAAEPSEADTAEPPQRTVS